MDAFNWWINLVIFIVYVITIASCIVVVLKENRNPIRSLSWVIALIFLPVVGLIFYIFFGRSLRGQHMISRMNKRKIITSMAPRHVNLDSQNLSRSDRNLIKLARNLSSSFYTINNRMEIFTNGEDKFTALKKDLNDAKRSIYVQYYIFLDDTLGHEIAQILMRKAREGVDVKVIYDHVGSFSVRNRFFKMMNDAGVETHPFFKVTFPQFANRVNWRNHRKIVIIDERIGYIGGMNIADRYIKGLPQGIWRDTHIRITGPAIGALQYAFAYDWNFMGQPVLDEHVPPTLCAPDEEAGMQLMTSGPMNQWSNIAFLLFKAIANAKRLIYIQTPYFLPTDSLLKALQAAALSNVDVRIMIPSRSDSAILRYASFSYISECLKAGIKIYLYEAGMLHSKTLVVDDEFCTVGSTNFDFRSFEHNFECNMFIYSTEVNAHMREIFMDDLRECTRVNAAQWRRRSLGQKTKESIVRLMSPVL